MVALFVFLNFIIFCRKKISVASFLSFLILISVLSSFALGYYTIPTDLGSFFNEVFIVLCLFILILGTKNWDFHRIKLPARRDLAFLEWVVFFIGGVALIINFYIVYASISHVLSSDLNITSYKNEGDAAEYLRTVVPGYFLTITYLLTPVGYLSLSLHFANFSRAKLAKTIVFFIISLNIPLVGFHALSRSAAILFILLYVCLFISLRKSLPKTAVRKLLAPSLVAFSCIFLVLMYITISRFYSAPNLSITAPSGIQLSPVFYWILDYFGQWYANGIEILSEFDFSKLWYGQGSFGMLRTILDYEVGLSEIREETIPEFATSFNGVIAVLVYDFTYIGAFIVVSSIYFFSMKLGGQNRTIINLYQLLVVICLLPPLVLFFTNNAYSNLFTSLSVFIISVFVFLSKLALNNSSKRKKVF